MIVTVSFKHVTIPRSTQLFAERVIRASLDRIAATEGHVEATLSEARGKFTVKFSLRTKDGSGLVCEACHQNLPTAVRDATDRVASGLTRQKEKKLRRRDRATPRHLVGGQLAPDTGTRDDDAFEWDEDDFEIIPERIAWGPTGRL